MIPAALYLLRANFALAVVPSIIETQVSTDYSFGPKIYGDTVVWEVDYSGGGSDIWMADVSDIDNIVEKQVTTESHDQGGPALYGNTAVWIDYRNSNWDLYMADISDPDDIVERPLVTESHVQLYPAVYGDTVVWEDYRNGSHGDIYMADISDPDNPDVQLVATNQSSYTHPDIYGDKVVWEDVRSGNRDIYMADISDPDNIVETRITTNSSPQCYPRIYGNKIVWHDYRNGDPNIYLANITDINNIVEIRLTSGSYGEYNPAIYGNKVLWENAVNESDDTEIYMADLTDLNNIVETRLTSSEYLQWSISIYDNKVVWTDYRNDVGDDMSNIYMATLVQPFNNFADADKFQQDINTGFITYSGSDLAHVLEVTFENEYIITTYDAQIVIPAGTVMTKTGGGTFDFTKMTMEDIAESLRNAYTTTIAGAVGIGISNSSLTFSQNISVTISVGGGYEGQALNVYYQNVGESEWNLAGSCSVENGLCEFETNHATDYMAGEDPDGEDEGDDNNEDDDEDEGYEKAKISSWRAIGYFADNETCPQKLKLIIKGNHFKNNTKVEIGGKKASSVSKKSHREITAVFCLTKMLNAQTSHKRKITVKNHGAKAAIADKQIDLESIFFYQSSNRGSEIDFNPRTYEGIKNIQRALVKLGFF